LCRSWFRDLRDHSNPQIRLLNSHHRSGPELREGKTVRAAIENGFARAFGTIIDTHMTTIISALFLFQFGTGPIKGFAVTLSIGLLANLFTAVLFTRMIYDYWLGRGKVERISI